MKGIQLLKEFVEEREQTLLKIIELVGIESPSFDVDGSIEASTWIEREFESASPGCDIEAIDIENVGRHLIVRIPGQTMEKPVLILGHSDTVHPRGTEELNPTRIEDARLYGCGTFDMKANIVVMIEVFRKLTQHGLQPYRPINVLIACDEEVGSKTGRPIVEEEALKAEFCLVFEPSLNGKVKTGRKGTGCYILKTHGIPSHAGLDPEKGASAILEISRQIEKLHEMTDFVVGTTVTVGTISGGTTTNVVPAEAECSIDVRFETMEEAARIEAAINDLKSFDERVTVEIIGEVNRPPMERTDGVIALFEKARKLAEGFGYDLHETKVGGASDGNFVGALGVPLLDGLGVAGDGAHTLKEYIEIEDIPMRATLLAKLLLAD